VSSPNLPSLGGFGWLGKEIYGVEAQHQWRRESVDEVAQIWGRGRLFIGWLEIWPLEKTYPGNSGLGAEFPGSSKGGNSGLGAEIPAWGRKFRPPGNSKMEFLARNSGPFQKVAPQLELRDLAKNRGGRKFWNFWPPEIPPKQNFRPLNRRLHHGLLKRT
jgi:hypothetical protein